MKRFFRCRATALWLALVAVVGACSSGTVRAQTSEIGSWVVVSSQDDAVRFSAVNAARTMRLQVTAQDGKEIFDSGTQPGGEVAWNGNDAQGHRVPSGVYLCAITLTDLAGKVHRDSESVSVQQTEAGTVAPVTQTTATPPSTATSPTMGAASITANAVGPLTGQGTIGRIPKWVGVNKLGDSVMTELNGKIGINNTAPSATLHITGPALPTATGAGAGASAASLLIVNGGAGAATSGSAKAGSGGSISLSAGAGGRAPAGGINGSGGSITLTPGSSGSGPGTAGSDGKVLLAPSTGNVGIGTTNPTSKLTVAGAVQSTRDGFKFPDGTVQTTAATNSGGLTSVTHNGTLTGQGTPSQPLGVKVPLTLSASSSDPVVKATNTGVGYAISGTGSSGSGVLGSSTDSYGVAGTSANSHGLYGISSTGNGVYGYSSNGSAGVYGTTYNSSGSGVAGDGYGGSAAGVLGKNTSGPGVWGRTSSGGAGVYGQSSGYGVYGNSTGGVGVYGISSNGGIGVYGTSSNGGVIGTGYVGVQGQANGTSNSQGVRGEDGANGSSTSTYAGVFNGRVVVTGTLIKPGGSFKIDHPLDPSNKYLSHSFVESPDMMNVYNGNTTTDANGEATVQLPGYFESLNRDFRYQLTCIGTFAQVIVGSEVKNNRFTIKSDKPNVKVSWQVTGIRQDAWANAHRIANEEDKTGAERGHYLHPAEFGQPAEKGITQFKAPAPAKAPELAAEVKFKP